MPLVHVGLPVSIRAQVRLWMHSQGCHVVHEEASSMQVVRKQHCRTW